MREAPFPTKCGICLGSGWVCEEHPTRPWGGMTKSKRACECGAGAPCVCNPVHEKNRAKGKHK